MEQQSVMWNRLSNKEGFSAVFSFIQSRSLTIDDESTRQNMKAELHYTR